MKQLAPPFIPGVTEADDVSKTVGEVPDFGLEHARVVDPDVALVEVHRDGEVRHAVRRTCRGARRRALPEDRGRAGAVAGAVAGDRLQA